MKMKKKPAIIAALITTLLIGLIMFAIGSNALSYTATAKISASATAASSTSPSTSDQQQIQQLQALVQQYQARETQYQAELQQAAQELSQANQLANTASSQTQNYQQILSQLQQAGLIQISSSGQITITAQQRGFNRSGG